MACGILDFKCGMEDFAKTAIGDAITNFANAVLEAFGTSVASLGTIWVNVGTPNLNGNGGSSAIAAGATPPGAGQIATVMGWMMWIGYAVAIMAVIGLAVHLMFRMGRGDGMLTLGKAGWIIVGVILLGAGTGLVSQLLPQGPIGAGGTVLFLQSSLWWYMLIFAAISVIIGAARLIWEQRAEPGKDLLKSLLTLIVVAGSGVTIVGILVTAADAFSVWILNGALQCNIAENDSTCFGQNIGTLLALTANPAAGGLGSLLIIILGIIAILATAFQIVLMVARGGMLVILTGILPLAASATNTEMGKSWFKKCISWLVAFILYKPAAAIVYAAAFQLTGTDVFKDDGTGMLAVLTGLMLMIIALFAMPALMRFVTPLVGAMAAGAGGAAVAAGAMAAIPTGAAAIGRMASGSFGGGKSNSPGNDGEKGPNGSTSTPPPPSPKSAPTSAPTGSGAAATGGKAAAAGGGAAAAGGAAGPWGIAAGAALDVAKGAGQAAAGAARSLGEQSTGEGKANGSH